MLQSLSLSPLRSIAADARTVGLYQPPPEIRTFAANLAILSQKRKNMVNAMS